MKATEARLLSFLKGPKQFLIPIYQRTYSWTTVECQRLWDDILQAAQDDRPAHFVGSIVYVERGLYSISQLPQLLVIDGQQRLTTMTLLLAALRQALPDGGGAEMTPQRLTNYYLLNNDEEDALRWKLVLTQGDELTLYRLIDGGQLPDAPSRHLVENARFFRDQIRRCGLPPEAIWRGVSKLVVVDISLDRDHDNPQLIFESLNSTGRALSQADLIRNFVLMGLEPKVQRALYEKYWYPMERRFGDAEDTAPFDRFMRDYLTVKTGTIPNIRDVYEAFKAYARGPAAGAVEALVADVATAADHFTRMAFGREPDPELRRRFADLNALKVDVAYPLLLELYGDYAAGRLDKSDLAAMLALLESYVFRRAICGIPTNSLNKTLPELARTVDRADRARYLESFKARLLLLDTFRHFPGDEEFTRAFATRDVYTLTTRRTYLLDRLENYDRKERVDVGAYTIEHVLPQNPDLSAAWRAMLGPDWEQVQARWLHTIGNLTLTGYNSELGDRPYAEKRDMPGGFKDSPIRLSAGLGQLEAWTEVEIRSRGEALAARAAQVWPSVDLPADVLARYRPARTARGWKGLAFGYADHKHLQGPILGLYEQLRNRVLEVGPDVREHVLKYYIAFKADTNFVDVVVRSKKLRCILNMPFEAVQDPEGRCDDVSHLGLWGNGNVRFYVHGEADLDYALFLIRQAYTWQVGTASGAPDGAAAPFDLTAFVDD